MSNKLDAAIIEKTWRAYLERGEVYRPGSEAPLNFNNYRGLMHWLPSEPRCQICYAPFEGVGGALVRHVLGLDRSKMNPRFCNSCETFVMTYHGGIELGLSMLFADVRGSTALAEQSSALDFSRLINRFYGTAADVLVRSNALIEKLIGDEVVGLYVPGLAGPGHARAAIDAAQAILRATGHGDPTGAWIPVGIGVHTGTAYVGAVGSSEGMTDIAALGDAVNTTARLASLAGPGEVLATEDACTAAGLDFTGLEVRHLQLKGRADPVDVRVLHATSA